MGKKSKKAGLVGDFSDEEVEATVEEAPKKGAKKQAKGSESDGDDKGVQKEVNGKGKKQSREEEKAVSKKKVVPVEDEDEDEKPQSAKKGKKKTSKSKEEDDEEETVSKGKQNAEAPQKPKKKKGGNWQEYDEDEGTNKKSTKEEESKGKTQLKKQESKKQKSEEDDQEEGDDEPKKGKGKSKGKKKKTADDDEGEENVEEKKPTPAPASAPKGKKGKKKADNYWDEEFEQDAIEQAQPVPSKDKADDADNKDASKGEKAKKKKKKGKATPKDEEQNDDAKQENTEAVANSKSSDTKAAESSKDSTKQTEKKDAKTKGPNSKTLEIIRKRQEELDRLQKEAEEQRQKEAEEERIRQEEERKIKAEEERKRRLKKEAKAKLQPKVSASVQARDAKNEAYLESLREKGLLPKDGSAPSTTDPSTGTDKKEKKKTMVYQNKKKAQTKKAAPGEDAVTTPTTTTETENIPGVTPTTPAPVEAPAQDDTVDDWENWEDHAEEVAKKVSDIKLDEKQAPTATATLTTDTAQQKPKGEENGKTASEKKETKSDKKNDKKGAKKGGKEEETQAEGTENEDAKELRSPICCILGHVDTGKTSLLDKIRQTNVQAGEAGGITQQIGASYFPMEAIRDKTKALGEKFANLQMKVPGLLIIDTPGHESFTNLRSRGSGLCDIAILVVDIMHALEPQTIESINLLRMRKTPFVVALNKVDRIYGWRSKSFNAFKDSLKLQDKSAVMEFEARTKETIAAFAEQSLNAALYYTIKDLKDFSKYVALVPTSAVTGEGIPDMLMLLVQLTQRKMAERLYFTKEVECTVLEVKVIDGLGTTLDVILVNGMLREGDTIVLCGINGPIVTTIRAILVPPPLKELRVKASYDKMKEIKAAMGAKIVAQDLEKAVAGSPLFVAESADDIDDLKAEVRKDYDSILKSVDTSAKGVYVQASTLGSLEALLTFLKSSKIPVSGVGIGPIHKRDVITASIMLEKAPEYAVILAFDVKVEKEAQAMADSAGVQIFTADIIYHLFDRFTKYMSDLRQKKRDAAAGQVVWPVIVRIKPDCIFNKKAPLVVGMEVLAGTLRIGTPLCIPKNNCLDIGVVTGIEKDHKQQQEAKKGSEVAVKIESSPEHAKEYGKQFDAEHEICSRISRESIDLLVSLWGEELSQADRQVIVKLKGELKIQ